jgi:hypothetical protein
MNNKLDKVIAIGALVGALAAASAVPTQAAQGRNAAFAAGAWAVPSLKPQAWRSMCGCALISSRAVSAARSSILAKPARRKWRATL